MIKKIILPLTLDYYNINTTFNLLAYYKNVLKFSGEIILNIEKRMDDINTSFTPISDVCFFDISFFESSSKYFSETDGNDDDYFALVSNDLIIQKFNLDCNFDGFVRYESKMIGFNNCNKINSNLIILKKKVWLEIYSFYEIFKNNFSIYRKLNQKILFEKILGSLCFKIKNINKLEMIKYNINLDYLNNEFLFDYYKPNYLYFQKSIIKHRQIHDILFDQNKDLVYAWREFCGEFS